MTNWPYRGWMHAGLDAWTLGIEASQVAGMRLARVAMGGSQASDEVRLMVSEKVESLFELQAALATGGLGTTPLGGTRKVLRHYSRKVRANRKRLG